MSTADAAPRAETPERRDPPADFSDDQCAAARLIAAALAKLEIDVGVDPDAETEARAARFGDVVAVLGKAGSGKTHLLAWASAALAGQGLRQVTGDVEQKPKRRGKAEAEPPSFAVVAPTNKAASVLRARGVAATTIHRIIYSPLYDPEFEALTEWLQDPAAGERPSLDGVEASQIDRALETFKAVRSAPAALASVGLRSSNFITGWKRRDESLTVGLVDEASMLDQTQLDDLKEIFEAVILFGDPAQLAPIVGKRGGGGADEGAMVFDTLPAPAVRRLGRVHRQTADNPILDLAHALQENIEFHEFEEAVGEAAARDDRVVLSPRVDADLMARSPVLVWRNATRIRLIGAFRAAHGLGDDQLAPGEPLICDGLELPARARNRRVDLEQAGLVKGAMAYWLGEGRKPGFAQIHVVGAPHPTFGVAAIIQIEKPGDAEPHLATAARQGAVFVHGAACTVHKAQGGQWPEVQVFAPDLYAAARSGRADAGAPLWRRLAYVAITRAERRLIWATRYAMARPQKELGIEDLVEGPLV